MSAPRGFLALLLVAAIGPTCGPALAGGLVLPPSSLVKSKEMLPDGSASAYGSAVAAIGDLNGDGVMDFAVGARATNGNSGGVWILQMQHNGAFAVVSQLTSLTPQLSPLLHPDDEFGASVAGIGDLDGDGVPDIAVGAPNDDDVAPAHLGSGMGINRGALYILLLTPVGGVKSVFKLSDLTPGMSLPSDFERFGAAVASLGNFDGPGPAKLVLAVGAPGDRDADVGPGFMRGAVYELFLTFSGAPLIDHVVKLSDTQGTPATLHLHDADLFGGSLAALADLNGDGVPDLAVGAPLDDDNIDGDTAPGANRGAVYVMLLNADGTVNRHQKISASSGGFAAHLGRSDFFGDGVAALADLDQNGVPDLAVGSGGNDDGASGAGAAWVVLLGYDTGTGAVFVKMPMRISNNAGNLGGGLNADDGFGSAVAAIGDLDLDGFPDLLAGVPGDGGGPSSAWILNLGHSSVMLASSLNPAPAGADIQFTASVSPGSGGVDFRDAAVTLGSAPLSLGQALFTTSTLIGGIHPMTAYYSGDSSNIGGPSAVLDQSVEQATATLLAMFTASPRADGIEVSWQLADPSLYVSTALERSDADQGAWTAVNAAAQTVNGVSTVLDAEVVVGQLYRYRLSVTLRDGSTRTLGQLSARAAQTVTAFALGPVSPNPASGPVAVTFALPRQTSVRLTLLDVQGREVAVLADGPRPPGIYQATWSGEGSRGVAPAGVYFVRYQTPAQTFVRRLVLER